MMRLKWYLGTFWDNLENFLTSLNYLECFPSYFQLFSSIIGSRDGPTDGWMDRQTLLKRYVDASKKDTSKTSG